MGVLWGFLGFFKSVFKSENVVRCKVLCGGTREMAKKLKVWQPECLKTTDLSYQH